MTVRNLPLNRATFRALLLGMCAFGLMAGAAEPLQAQTLRIRLNSDIRTTEPGTNRDGNTDAVILHMAEGLVAFKEDGSVGPLLAKSYSVSPDGKTYTFDLREGIKFHNGVTMTADDVVASMKRYLEPERQWRCLPEFQGSVAKIESLTAVGAHQVVFKLDRPTALFLVTLARPDCGEAAVVHKDSFGADGKWKDIIGTGPFKMSEWRRGQYIELAKFDGYAARSEPRDGHTGGKIAQVEKVRFVVIPDDAAAKAAILGGQIDVADGMSPADLTTLRQSAATTVDMSPTMNLIAIVFRSESTAFNDVKVRRALSLAIDRKQLTEGVRPGTLAKANASPIPAGSAYYTGPHAVLPGRDLAAAKKLLAEAGYKGEPITLYATRRYQELYDSAVIAQSMAAEAGMNVRIQIIEWPDEVQRFMQAEYAAMSFVFSPRPDASLNFEMFLGPQKRKPWTSERALALLDKSMAENVPERRQALFDEMYALMLEDVPMIPLFNDVVISGLRRNVTGYKGWLLAHPRAWGVRLN